jgi:hypothetical protein
VGDRDGHDRVSVTSGGTEGIVNAESGGYISDVDS